jgi:hypothetical protein
VFNTVESFRLVEGQGYTGNVSLCAVVKDVSMYDRKFVSLRCRTFGAGWINCGMAF